MSPRASVLLPVYNGAPFLRESIDSILIQDFADFELIIINDGSLDDSEAIVKRYTDSRIRYVEQANRGLPATLNRGLEMAEGDIIIRQDQDDISLPSRIGCQVRQLDADRELGVVGCWAEIVDEVGVPDGRAHRHPTGLAALRMEVLFNTPFVHSAVAIRKSVLERIGGYSIDPQRQPPEDFELWSRLLRTSHAANIPEVLVRYREVSSSMSRVMKRDFVERMVCLGAENLIYWSGQAGIAANPAIAAFAARLMAEQNAPHDRAVGRDEVLQLFDAACSGILGSNPCDAEAERSRGNLRFLLKRAWSVGAASTGLGRQFARARWKVARLFGG